MLKVYILIIVIGILGGVAYGAKYYYDTTQATIATLRENNIQLEIAVQTAEESMKTWQEEHTKISKLNTQLQTSLQKAEAYGDSLRNKLQELNLVRDALNDAKKLEGKMNGATAKLWRNIIKDTGGDSNRDLPYWLQQPETGTGNQDSNQNRENSDTNSSTTETDTTQ
jgi:small-conductance mechanosensitive channel